jgi:uncharacterized BrkB/YihY/UPF0761 family membrane protein
VTAEVSGSSPPTGSPLEATRFFVNACWSTLVTLVRVLVGALADCRQRRCFSLSASMAFFALLAFFPMVFLLLYGLSVVVSADRIGHEFRLSFFQGFRPGLGAELAEEITRVATE